MNNVCEEEKMCEINAFFSKIVLLFFFKLGLKSFFFSGLGPQKYFPFGPKA